MPNSASRFMFDGIGGASPSLAPVLGLIKLTPRGGAGRDRSGPDMDGFRNRGGDPLTDLEFPIGICWSFDGLRILATGSDGLLYAGSKLGFGRRNNSELCSGFSISCTASSSAAGGGPNPPYPFFLGNVGSPNPDLELFVLLVSVRECAELAVDGLWMLPPISPVLVDIVSLKLEGVFGVWRPLSSAGRRSFTSKGPGAIVFIFCSSPPVVTVIGLIGAYIGSASAYLSPMPLWPPG